MLRSVSARWFELMVPRESVARALEALAATGRVELEPDSADEEDLIPIPRVELELARLAALERRYHAWWPAPEAIRTRRNWLLERELKAAMERVEQWAEAAEPHVQRIERLTRELGELARLEELCLAARGDRDLDFSELAAPDSAHAARVFILPSESETPPPVEALLTRRLDSSAATWLIVFGRSERVAHLAEQLEGQRARTLLLPRWLKGNPEQARVRVLQRKAAAERLEARDRARIAQFSEQFQLARALGHLRRVAWLAEHLEGITTSEYMARLRGWTCDNDSSAIAAALDQAGIPCAVALPPSPGGRMAPSICVNPPWAKPFELFAGLVGTPGRNEADPSILVAMIALR
jgi:V/A-type H+-transporting ATPase subunit I